MTKSGITWISYADFGERFIARAVTRERIEAGLSGIAGRALRIGTFIKGPLGMAGVVAEGAVGQPTITRTELTVAYGLMIPVTMSAMVTLAGQRLSVEVGIEINLELRAKAAAPLLIAIEIPKITEKDVRIVVRAEALGASWGWIVQPIGEVLRRELANRLNAMVAEPDNVRRRTFDIAARIDDTEDNIPALLHWISYGEFGQNFFEHALTPQRIEGAVADLDGRTIDLGPLKAGPRDVATVTATGKVGKPSVAAAERATGGGDLIAFTVRVPVALDLNVALGGDNRYKAAIEIPISVTGRPASDLLLVPVVEAPAQAHIAIDLKALSTRAKLLGFLGNVKNQIRHQVAETAKAEVGEPNSRYVDVGERVDSA